MSTKTTTDADPSAEELGVLFVHGIGGQRQGETLVRFGEPLYRWLDGWLRGGDPDSGTRPVTISESSLKPGDSEPAHLRLSARWPARAGERRLNWLLTESWWAGSFEAPAATGVALWAAGFGPRALGRFVRRRQRTIDAVLRNGFEESGDKEGLVDGLTSNWLFWFVVVPLWVAWTVVLALSVVVLDLALWSILLLVFLPLSLLRPLRPFLTRLQLMLSNVVGDTYVLERSPFAFAAMTAAVQRDLDWLESRTSRIAVVAHSQGSVLAHRALRERPRSSVAVFVTVGSALRLLAEGADDSDDGRDPPALHRPDGTAVPWVDYFASRDPVSDGPLWRESRPANATATPVHNFGSFLRDHTGYWRNVDGFIASLTLRLAGLDGLKLDQMDGADRRALTRAPRHRERRTHVLIGARYLIACTALVALVGLGPSRLRDLGGFSEDVIGLVAELFGSDLDDPLSPTLATAAGALQVGLAALALYLVPVLAWNRWSREALDRMYRRSRAATPLGPRALVAAPASIAALATAILVFTLAGTGMVTTIVLVAATAAAVTLCGSILWADRPPPPPLPPQPVLSPPDALTVDCVYAYQEGVATVRKVRLIDAEPSIPEMTSVDGGWTPGDEKVWVRILDEPPAEPEKWTSHAPLDGEAMVQPGALVCAWSDYTTWRAECDRLRAAWEGEETAGVA